MSLHSGTGDGKSKNKKGDEVSEKVSERLKEYIEEEFESFKSVSLNHGFEIDEENQGEAFVIFMCGLISGLNYPGPRLEKGDP